MDCPQWLAVSTLEVYIIQSIIQYVHYDTQTKYLAGSLSGGTWKRRHWRYLQSMQWLPWRECKVAYTAVQKDTMPQCTRYTPETAMTHYIARTTVHKGPGPKSWTTWHFTVQVVSVSRMTVTSPRLVPCRCSDSDSSCSACSGLENGSEWCNHEHDDSSWQSTLVTLSSHTKVKKSRTR